MIPILFPADATTFVTNGLGRLPECLRCDVTEERNGIYELEMELPITARHYAEIVEGMILSVIHDDTKTRQPFIIYRRTAPINGIVTFYAHHVSYLLSGIVLRPYTAETCAEALALMPTYSMSPNPFTFWTDKQTTASFKVDIPTGIRQQLAGIRGSVLDTFGGGEYEFDNFAVKLYQSRGNDSGVQIRYGKNLLDVEKEVDVSGIAGGVVGWWKGGDPGAETVVYTSVIYADGYGPGAPVLSLDLSGEFSEAPTVADLTARVNQYISNTKPQEPVINVKVDFVALWQTPEYKDIAPLERVRLCDTVHVIYDALGVDVESKVIRTKYDVLTERYEEIELGQPKTNFTELITAKAEDLINAFPTRSMIQAAVDHATELITGGLGGHVVMTLNADGEPQEILIMDTDDITTAVNVIRINQAGIGFSTTGYNGPFRSAWTIDGHFVADFIDTGNLNAALITAGTMLADRILGGTLRLGGASFGEGSLVAYDSNDVIRASIDKYGALFRYWDANVSGNTAYVALGYYNSFGDYPVALYGQSVASNNLIMSLTTLNGSSGGTTYKGYAIDTNTYSQYCPDLLYIHLGLERIEFWRDTTYNNSYILVLPGLTNVNGAFSAGETTIDGDFTVGSRYTKSKIADTENYSRRLLYCYEMATPVFGDIGEGVIDEDGSCYVSIDDIYTETIDQGSEYQVFLQKEGAGDLWIEEKNRQYFVVSGTPGLSFAWEIKAKQKGFETTRLEEPGIINGMKDGTQDPSAILEQDAADYLKGIEEVYHEAA